MKHRREDKEHESDDEVPETAPLGRSPGPIVEAKVYGEAKAYGRAAWKNFLGMTVGSFLFGLSVAPGEGPFWDGIVAAFALEDPWSHVHLDRAVTNRTGPVLQADLVASCPYFNDNGVKVDFNTGRRLGNGLSEYLEGLAFATLANQPFRSVRQTGSSSFLRHLPQFFPVPRPGGQAWSNEVLSACSACRDLGVSFHACQGAWSNARVRETLRGAILAALRAEGLEKVRDEFAEGEVLVHMRCSSETIFSHQAYGPSAFSIFDEIPKNTTHVTIMDGEEAGQYHPCVEIRKSAIERLQRLLPNATVKAQTGNEDAESVSMDFARCVFAPVLVRGVSSFSLWAAFARTGKVISPRNPLEHWRWSTLDLGHNWHWVDAPVLLPSRITNELIVPWLQQH